MSSLLCLRFPAALRALVLGLLVLGMVMKPVLASACEASDVRLALVTKSQPATQLPSSGTESCCPAQSCNECCAHTVAMTPALNDARTFLRATGPLRRSSLKFEPTAYPV